MAKRYVVAAALLAGIAIMMPADFSVYAATDTDAEIETLNKQIKEKQEKVKQLESSINEYKDKIKKTQLESASLGNQVTLLENSITETSLDIRATEEKIDTITLEIERLQLSIEAKENVIKRQKDILKELVQTIHFEDRKKYIEILAAYDTFSDFYNRLQYLERIESDLGKSVQSIRIAKEEVEEKKQQAEDRKKSYVTLNEQLGNQKKDLDERVNHKNILLAQTKASEATYKTLLAQLRRQYQQIENEIVSIEKEVRRKLEKDKRIGELGEAGQLSWPAPSRYITATFHDPEYPFRNVFEHSGIDIRAGQGTAVRAAAPGYVARARRCSSASCYSYIMIIHSGGISTVYGHLSGIVATEDQFVARGDVIGYSGGTPGTNGAGPFVTGPHLHFEVRKSGIPVDPMGFL